MAQDRFSSSNQSALKRQGRTRLEYERFEDRNLLAADLLAGPELPSFSQVEIREFAQQPDRSVISQLSASSETAELQTGLNGLAQIASETSNGQTATVFQQTWNGLPIYGSWLTTLQNEAGELINVRDQTLQNIQGLAENTDPINPEQAITFATHGLTKPSLMDSSVRSAWYTAGQNVRLSWVVETSVSNPQGDVVSQYETWVDAFDGDVFTQDSQGQYVESLLEDPVVDRGVFPRIVINDAIGPAGSQTYADPFDAVVSVSVGCTGVLVAPDAVLSARHCGIRPGDTVSFGEDSFNPTGTFTVATSVDPAGNGSLLDGGDFTILTLETSVPATIAIPMRLTDATDELVGVTAATIGYGLNGVGSVGHEFSADGRRWGGENIIDAFGIPSANSGDNIISTDFDDDSGAGNTIVGSDPTPLEFEATTAPGDSGGPILVQQNGEWLIAGVLSGGTTGNSVYGDISWWTGTALFRTEIEAVGGEFVEDEAALGFSDEDFFVGDTIDIRIFDGNAVGNITVTVTSDLGDSETLTAAPTSPGEYNFSLDSANANIVFNDGTLQVDAGDMIQVTYNDPDDGNGVPVTLVDTAFVIDVSASELIGVDFDVIDSVAPVGWLSVADGSDQSFSDLGNEQLAETPVDLTINGTWTALDVEVDPSTIPNYTNLISRVDGQIQTGGQAIELVWDDLVASRDYLVYVMAAEGVFDSIEQSVSIQGLGSPVVFEQRFGTNDLFINDQLGDSNRDLVEYAQLITSNIDGEITINVTPIGGTQDVVLSSIALVPYDAGIDAISDTALTTEDDPVSINVTANDIETDGQAITLVSVSDPGNGTATITSTGTVEYVPGPSFNGTDEFTYVITDPDGNQSTGAVMVSVAAVNDAPTGVLLSPSIVSEDLSTAVDAFVGTLTGIDVDDASHTFSLATGAGDADNDDFRIDGDQLFIRAGTDIDFDNQSQYSIRVEVSDGEMTTEAVLTIVVREVTSAVRVSLGDGDDQRSMVSEAVVSFDEIVAIDAGAFEVIKRGPGGGTVGVIPVIDNSSGQTVVTLTFTGQFVTSTGSLVDGNYQLTVVGDQITTSSGALDGDGNGTPGGDFLFGDTEADNFFRFYGDVDGDRTVSALDLLRFRQTFFQSNGDAGFDERFDFDGDGAISSLDLLRFRQNFFDRLDFS